MRKVEPLLQQMLTQAQAQEIAAEIVARERLYRLTPSMLRRRTLGYRYQCPQLRALPPQVHGEVYNHAVLGLRDTHAYNQLLVAALISLAAVCLLTPLDFTSTLVLAGITLATCGGTFAFSLVYVRSAVKLIAAEMAKLGY